MRDDVWMDRFLADWRSAELSPADRAMLEYAEKLTLINDATAVFVCNNSNRPLTFFAKTAATFKACLELGEKSVGTRIFFMTRYFSTTKVLYRNPVENDVNQSE